MNEISQNLTVSQGWRSAGWWHRLRDSLIAMAISVFIIVFLYQPVKVEGTSMMPGLADQGLSS